MHYILQFLYWKKNIVILQISKNVNIIENVLRIYSNLTFDCQFDIFFRRIFVISPNLVFGALNTRPSVRAALATHSHVMPSIMPGIEPDICGSHISGGVPQSQRDTFPDYGVDIFNQAKGGCVPICHSAFPLSLASWKIRLKYKPFADAYFLGTLTDGRTHTHTQGFIGNGWRIPNFRLKFQSKVEYEYILKTFMILFTHFLIKFINQQFIFSKYPEIVMHVLGMLKWNS